VEVGQHGADAAKGESRGDEKIGPGLTGLDRAPPRRQSSLERANRSRTDADDPPPVTDGAAATFRQALLYAVALLPVSLLPSVLGTTGPVYFFGALACSGWLLWATVRVALDHSRANARRLFLASVLYLPLILALLVANKVG